MLLRGAECKTQEQEGPWDLNGKQGTQHAHWEMEDSEGREGDEQNKKG